MRCTLQGKYRPSLELLEDRVTPSIAMNDGILSVRGSTANDYIVVNYAQPDDSTSDVQATVLNASGQVVESASFDSAPIFLIRFYGKEGNDYLLNSTNIRSDMDAGAGDDWLKGGGGFQDHLSGGAGSDNYLFSEQRWTFNFSGGAFGGFLVIGNHADLGFHIVDEAPNIDTDTLWFNEYIITNPAAPFYLDLASTDWQNFPESLTLQISNATGIEAVHGTRSQDIITGNMRDNFIYGEEGSDYLNGLEGNDYLNGGPDDDRYGFGIDRHVDLGDLGRDTIADEEGRDELLFEDMPAGVIVDLAMVEPQVASSGRLQLLFESGASIERVSGSFFNDVLRGNRLDNSLYGSLGNDTLEGRAGNDTLQGDRISNEPDAGNDTYVFTGEFNLGRDHIIEKAGRDTLDFRGFAYGITLDLDVRGTQTPRAGHLELSMLDVNIEIVRGTSFADTIWGDDSRNDIFGYSGNDVLHGRGGADELFGGTGRDQLFGESGRDRLDGGKDRARDELTGGSSDDIFVFHYTAGYEEQLLLDFVQGADEIELADL